MRAIVVGSGAGGATAASELARNGFDVLILEAGRPFSPLTRKIAWLNPLRGSWLLKDETSIRRIFPSYWTTRGSEELVILHGQAEGGSTVVSCGNMVRAEHGLREIGLDLSPEFQEIERTLQICPVSREKWRPLTQNMFDAAEELGHQPKPTPKVQDQNKCIQCGYCEVGCFTGAKWDSRRVYRDLIGRGITLQTDSRVEKLIIEENRAKGVIVSRGSSVERIEGDAVVLSAGGVGTAQILKASGLPAVDRLWADVVVTVGGELKNARQLHEPPMVWYSKKEDYILSPYFDLLSYWFHRPWKDVAMQDRVGMMVKLADAESGTVNADGTVVKSLTKADRDSLEEGKAEAREVMESCGVTGPFVDGMIHGGHLGGTVPLTGSDVETMHPSWLAQDLWVADLSLMPRSQGLPTMLTTAALALRVARRIVKEKLVRESEADVSTGWVYPAIPAGTRIQVP
jgi:choline dehydrogenase-like flavoprotein